MSTTEAVNKVEHKYAGQVLVVDDDEILLDLLSARLEECGFRVTCASSIKDVNTAVRVRNYDYVLLDLFLGDENGLDAIPSIVSQNPYAVVIVMSASGTISLAVDAMERGAQSFVAKSKDASDIVDALMKRVDQTFPKRMLGNTRGETSDAYGIVGKSQPILSVIQRVEQVGAVDSTVLITGESGTGKELVARAIHLTSARKDQVFEAINCAAIPANLIESELFGHRRGAFTDAKSDRKGLFEICSEGTLFLDEIGELPLALQSKLLRALQEKEVLPLGSSSPITVRTRVVAATNKDLQQEVRNANFRSDLYYRLSVLHLHLPALRERREDIPLLIRHFLKRFNERFDRTVAMPPHDLEARLCAYPWPGNIRELQNALERGVVLSQDGQLHLEDMIGDSLREEFDGGELDSSGGGDPAMWDAPLSEAKKNFERVYLRRLLEVTRGNISEMARLSGRYRTDIYRLMSKYGVVWDEFRDG